MAYTPTNWQTGDIITAVKLNNAETGIDEAHDAIETPTNSTVATETAEIIDIPSTAVEGTLIDEVSGNTVVNLLEDDVAGCESTAGWSTDAATVAVNSSENLEGTNCLKITLTGASGSIYRNILSLLDTSKYYLISAHMKNGDLATGTRLGMDIQNDTGDKVGSTIIATSYTRDAVILEPTDFDAATGALLYIQCLGSSTQFGYVDAIMLQEITSAEYALGADALLEKYAYHRGTKDTNLTRIKSVGKNLFGGELELGIINSLTGLNSDAVLDRVRTPHFIKVDSLTQYTIDDDLGYQYNVYEYTSNLEFIQEIPTTSTFTTQSNCSFIRFRTKNAAEDDFNVKIQLEKGSSATTYKAYKESYALVPQVTRSVPNGVADTFDANNSVLTKRIAKYTLTADDVDSITTGTNVQRAAIGLDAFSGIEAQTASTVDNGTLVEDYLAETNAADNAGDEDKWYTNASNLFILVSLGTWADLAAAKTALTGTIVRYELASASYVTTEYLPKTLTAYPGGTIYTEAFEEFYDFYSSGLDANTNTISSVDDIEYVDKYDLITGAVTSVDLDDVTVSGGAITAITGASDGELYVVGFRYNNESTIASNTYQYNTNLKAQVNSNTEETRRLSKSVEQNNEVLKKKLDKAGGTLDGDLVVNGQTTLNGGASEADALLEKAIQIGDGTTAGRNIYTIEDVDGGFEFYTGLYGAGTLLGTLDKNGNFIAEGYLDADDVKIAGSSILANNGGHTQSVQSTPTGEKTIQIALGASDYNFGKCAIYVAEITIGLSVSFSETAARAIIWNNAGGIGGYDMRANANPSSTAQQFNLGSGNYIKTIRINGSNLEIVYNHATGGDLTWDIDWEVWK